MTGFNLPSNFHPNPDRIGRNVRRRYVPPQISLSLEAQSEDSDNSESSYSSAPEPLEDMAVNGKTLREYSAPSSNNFQGLEDPADGAFELKSGLINMVQASPFCGKATEDANAHLRNFLEVSSTINPNGTPLATIRFRLFPFSLLGKAKEWFYTNKPSFDNNWQTCADAFLTKYFPVGKTNALRGKITGFQQQDGETVPEAWERMQEYIAACPHHGMESWLVTQSFFHGLNRRSQEYLDAAAGGAFLALDVARAKALVEKIAFHQSWVGERQAPRTKGVHQIDSIDMLAAKMDLLLKKMEAPAHSQLEGINSVIKNQLSFNKMIETQVAQLAASLPKPNTGKLPGQPEVPVKENVSAVTTRTGKSTRDPLSPPIADTLQENEAEDKEEDEEPTAASKEREEAPKAPEVNRDPTFLPFPERKRRSTTDEQFDRFVEVIKKVHINIPLLDAMQVPTYTKYIKDILGNKRSLPKSEMVKLTEECSAAILNPQPKKKRDPGCPTISCSIGDLEFNNALCDLGASVSVMPKVIFDKLKYLSLVSTPMCLQLADQSVRYPAGVAENVPVRVRNGFIPVDFVVLDMENDAKTSLILGRPFLSTANATIDVGSGLIRLNINGGEENFAFQPKEEVHQVSMVREVKQKTVVPTAEMLGKLLETLCALEKRRHNHENAKRRIARKKVPAEAERDETKKPPRRTKKVWREKKSTDPSTEKSKCPAQDTKSEPSP